jgi:hypothetical protein
MAWHCHPLCQKSLVLFSHYPDSLPYALAEHYLTTGSNATRINYETLGNVVPELPAHIFPRYAAEVAELRQKPVWFYDWEQARLFQIKSTVPYNIAWPCVFKKNSLANLKKGKMLCGMNYSD